MTDTGGIRFDTRDLIDALDFGVIAMAADGTVAGYSKTESALSGLAKDRVTGRHFFSAVAPCTNNFLTSHCHETENVLARTIEYVSTMRIKPEKVKLRMLKRADTALNGAKSGGRDRLVTA